MPPLFGAAAVILAVALICVAATRYATLHGDALERIRQSEYLQGYDDGQAILYNAALQHVDELGELSRPAPSYKMRGPAPDQWLHDALADLYAWSAREQDKARRWYWRTFNGTPRERPLELEPGPAQLTLELEQ